jgi:hypothetical protein
MYAAGCGYLLLGCRIYAPGSLLDLMARGGGERLHHERSSRAGSYRSLRSGSRWAATPLRPLAVEHPDRVERPLASTFGHDTLILGR